jgi:glucokinase
MLLAGDVGGTKTNLAIYTPEQGVRAPLAEATLPSARFESLQALVREFLKQVDVRVERASFGVAGPVVDGRAKITNLPWTMEEKQLQEALSIPVVRLLNDLAAIAHAVPSLEASDLHMLNEGQAVSGGPLAVVAPGTGLGEAFLMWDGSRYLAFASEGGHTDFAPTDRLQIGLLQYLLERSDHVSFEHVCSGMGLPNIYAFLRESGYAEEPGWLAEQLAVADDPNPIIAKAALAKTSELCVATLDLFVTILGAEAGNMALKVLATGGIYLGGGIPPKILPALAEERFMQAFMSKGRFSDMLARVPVHVILNPKSALLGAACHGLEVQGSVP